MGIRCTTHTSEFQTENKTCPDISGNSVVDETIFIGGEEEGAVEDYPVTEIMDICYYRPLSWTFGMNVTIHCLYVIYRDCN